MSKGTNEHGFQLKHPRDEASLSFSAWLRALTV